MPQAPEFLQQKWHSGRAERQLGNRFTYYKGIIRPRRLGRISPEDMSAITYLVLEWDYGFSKTPRTILANGKKKTKGIRA